MLTKKVYLTFILYLTLIHSVSAQFDIRVTAGYGKISLKPETNLDINVRSGNYFTVGMQADYYLSEVFGIGLGVDYYPGKSNFDVILSDYSNSYTGMDTWEADPISRQYLFTVKSNIPDIYEVNTISLLDFPVSGVFRFPISNDIFFTTRIGFKLGVSLNDSYQLVSSDLYTRLYFADWDLELFNIPAHGLYDSRTDWHPEGKIDFKNVYSTFYEAGFDFQMPSVKIRVTGYFSYGINNIMPVHNSSLIYWREQYNNILSLPESVKVAQFGIKLGIGFVKNIQCPWEYAFIGDGRSQPGI